LMRKFDPGVLLELIEKYKVTAFAAVPTVYNSLLLEQDLENRDLASLRICLSSGAPLPELVVRNFKQKTGLLINVGWGMTETSPQLTIAPLVIFMPHFVGIPLGEMEVIALDESHKILSLGEVGELAAKGPQVMKGYWRNPIETSKVFTEDGWLLTGDLGYVSLEGVFVLGRRKDVINSGGYKVWPQEVEDVLRENEHVIDAVVVGTKDEYFGECVKAFVVLNTPIQESELKNFCKARLADYKAPKVFEFRNSLPKSSVGKILRRSLVDQDSQAY
jgi:long-chain acyl-CoA synthetase